MPHFNPFDTDFDGDVDGIDFVEFDHLRPDMLALDDGQPHDHERDALRADHRHDDDKTDKF